MARAVFVLSAGRCGTQWLARTLSRYFFDLVDAHHEPIDHKYCPRLQLGSRDLSIEHPYRIEVQRHLDRLSARAGPQIYIETGWPAVGAAALLKRSLGPEVAFVHVARHPVPSAYSMATHGYYSPTRHDGYTRYAFLQPSDEVCYSLEYIKRWPTMSDFEKCLFHWSQIQVESRRIVSELPSDSVFQCTAESLFDDSSSALEMMLDFIGLPIRASALKQRTVIVDQFRASVSSAVEWRRAADHPDLLEVGKAMGFSLDEVSDSCLTERYVAASDPPSPTAAQSHPLGHARG